MIKKVGEKYRVVSRSGKNLGESSSKEGAKKRMREVEYFKRREK